MIKKSYLFLTLLTAFLWLGSGNVWGAQSLPYSYGFEDYPFVGWTKANPSGKNDSKFVQNGTSKKTGSYGIQFNSYSTSGENTQYLISPELDAPTGIDLSFYFKNSNSGKAELFKVGYSTTDAEIASFTFGDEISKSDAAWEEYTHSFPAGTKYIAVYYYSNYQYYLFVDDFTFAVGSDVPASCAKPTLADPVQNTPVKATLSWTKAEGEDNYQYLYVEKNGTPDWTGVAAENTNSVELDGLTAGVEYDFYVRTYCSGEDQSDPVKKTFSTTCPAPTAPQVTNITTTTATLSWTAAGGGISDYQYIVVARGGTEDWTTPTLVEGATTASITTGLAAGTKYDVYVRSYYNATTVSASVKAQFQTPCNAMSIEDFDGTFESETAGSGLMPDCWEAAASFVYSSTTYPYVRNGFSANNGDQWLSFYGGSNPNIAVLPVFTEALNTLTVSFYYKNGSTWGGYFSLGYYKNGVFTAYEGAANLERKTTYTYFEMALPNVAAAEGARLAIQYAGSSYNYEASIDDVTVTVTPSCTKPSVPTVSNIVYNGATIDWTENGSAEAWKVQYSTDNTNWTTANGGDAVTAHPYNLRGLTSGTPYYVRVLSVCGPTDESPAVAAASTFTPTCVKPGVPTISAKTTTTATIGWTVNSGEAEWNLQYKKSSDADYTTVAGVTENPYTLTGLTSGTTYQVRVAATCNGTYTTATTFDTECEAKGLPYEWAFDALTCWTMEDQVSNTGLYENMFRFYYGYSNQYLISPEFVASANQVQVEFEYKVYSSTETFHVGYSTTTNEVSAFTWGDEIAATNTSALTYSEKFPVGVKYIAIKYTSYDKYYLYIDNFSVSEYVAPSCAVPTALAVSEISTTGAKVTWTSDAASFALEYKKTSDAGWTAASGTITSPFTLSGLVANETEYSVHVKAICGVGNESDWVELASPFKTECVNKTVTELAAWEENFESQTSGKIPTCWAEVSSYSVSAYTQVNASAAKDGSLGVQVYTYGTNTEIALLPVFETEIKNLKISFDYKNQGTNSRYAALEVGYYSGGAFTNVTTLDKTTAFAASGEIEMPKTAPDGARIAFRVVGAYSGYNGSAYIDNISVIRKPACAVPTITAAEATSTGAVVSWTPGDEESQWNLQYREITEPESSWTLVEDVTTGHEITGLAVDHNYEVQVQAYCDATHQSAWSASTNFSPVCNAPSALAVTARTQNSASFSWTSSESSWVLQYSADGENWESENVAANPFTLNGLSAGQTYQAKIQSACGSAFSNVVSFTTWCDSKLGLPVNLTSFTAIPSCWEESPAGAISSFANNKLCFSGEGEKFLYLPQTSINLNQLSVTFTFSGSLQFGYIDAPNGEFHAFASQPTTGVELDLAAEAAAAKYIAIRYNGANSWAQSSISAISIRKTPTCLKPTGVAGTPGVGSASISWTAGGSETAWNLQYKTGSADWTTVAVNENPFALNGLEQGVSYKVRVQAACAGEDPSDWSDEASFTTNCAALNELPFIADFSVALSSCWTIHSESSSSYYIPAANTSMNQLKMDGGKNGSSNNVVVLPAFSADLSGAVLSLEYKNGAAGANYAQLEIGYVTDKNDASSFVIIGEAWEQSTSFTEARVALADVTSGRQIALRFAGANSHSDMSIKNLRILEQLNLVDNVDNTATLDAHNGKAVDVTLGRTIFCDGDYNTLCLPFNLSEEQLAKSPLAGATIKAFKYAVIEPDELQVRVIDVEGGLQAGVPYLLKKTGDDIVNPFFKNVTISATAGKTIGQDQPVEFIGILAPVAFTQDDSNTLFVYTNNTLTWSGKESSSLKSFRAYFNRTASAGAPIRRGMRARIVEHDEEVTGINNTNTNDVQSVKFIENNQVVIIRNGIKYNIQGQVIE